MFFRGKGDQAMATEQDDYVKMVNENEDAFLQILMGKTEADNGVSRIFRQKCEVPGLNNEIKRALLKIKESVEQKLNEL